MKMPLTVKPNPHSWLWPVVLFLLSGLPASSQQVKFGNSYVNLTRKTSGGTVQPGDTLEIRTNYYFKSGYNGNNIYYVRYVDNIPSNCSYAGDSLRLITNEGLTYQKFSNASDGDAGTYVAAPGAGAYNVRINIGSGATTPASNDPTNASGAGSLKPNTSKPRAGGGLLVTTAFKVKVTGAVGDTITLGAGHLYYKLSNSIAAADTIVNAIQYQILISNDDPICSGAIGKNFVAEAGGSFDSGTVQNRSYGPDFPIPSYTYLNNMGPSVAVGDGSYAIVNNTSPRASTWPYAKKTPNCSGASSSQDSCVNRMFSGYWDIIGDHTGSNNAAGNPPVANGSQGGYMLLVNADYATSEAYRQSISGLCPNTSYEFSLWVRNVCTNCGIDSNGTATYKPGVLPNLTFAIDGLDRYSSGQVDTLGWMKKGFLFKTGTAQTSITISIRNNASGGGGNDWAIDDIALVTCNPNLDMQPSGNANVCYGNSVDMSTLVSSFFNNYTYWTWEMSSDNGATWGSTGQSGNSVPSLNGSNYEYTSTYPSFLADSSQHLKQYRFKVASSATNLADDNCSFIASTIITVLVNNCSEVLKTSLVSFQGTLSDGLARLHWTTDNEQPGTFYEVQKSGDNQAYVTIGTVAARAPAGFGTVYQFTDPDPVKGEVFYRLRLLEGSKESYSQTIVLKQENDFSIRSLVNPFINLISFDLQMPKSGLVKISLIDSYGRVLLQENRNLSGGINKVQLTGLGGLASGTYTMRIQFENTQVYRRVMKAAY